MQMLGQNSPSRLAKQLVVPLIATVKCGAFLIYGVPIMFTVDQSKDGSPGYVLTSSPKLD